MKKKKRSKDKSVFDTILRRLNEVEAVVWMLHTAHHDCGKWDCVFKAKQLSNTRDV